MTTLHERLQAVINSNNSLYSNNINYPTYAGIPNINTGIPNILINLPDTVFDINPVPCYPAVGQVWTINNIKDPSKLDLFYIIKIRNFTDSSGIQRNMLGIIEKNGQTEEWDGPFEVLDYDVFNHLFFQFKAILDLSDNLVLRELLSDVTSYCGDNAKRHKIIMAVLAANTSDLILEECLNESEKLYSKPLLLNEPKLA